MAQTANFFKGDEVKFALTLEAPGFSMDDDEFEIEVKAGSSSIFGRKTPQAGDPTDVIIYSETVTIPPAEEGGEPTEGTVWYVIANTAKLKENNKVFVVATAKIVDAHADDGVRNSIARVELGYLNAI